MVRAVRGFDFFDVRFGRRGHGLVEAEGEDEHGGAEPEDAKNGRFV